MKQNKGVIKINEDKKIVYDFSFPPHTNVFTIGLFYINPQGYWCDSTSVFNTREEAINKIKSLIMVEINLL